ncbi:hypothetical protein [Hyphomicrobium sp.]|uniref:hypothetical protein n=1 Tax=Hyphomicrobium sp. TaxID=82 RepID=UPI0025B8998A|nr:hypothetical protein [Hyphomicrobium sp.]MCC7252802.1 hypothetical protein [Hyphomicrobium sp.]
MSSLDPFPAWLLPLALGLFVAALLLMRRRTRRGSWQRGQDANARQDGGAYAAYGAPSDGGWSGSGKGKHACDGDNGGGSDGGGDGGGGGGD